MSFVTLYRRVLALLAGEKRSVVLLVSGAVALVLTQFAEPVLLGRLINLLTGAHERGLGFAQLAPTIAAWIGLALASIAAAVVVSLFADRLAHRRRLATMALFFEHALDLPMSFHAATHSGRSLKVMIESSNAMFVVYLSLFRENLAALAVADRRAAAVALAQLASRPAARRPRRPLRLSSRPTCAAARKRCRTRSRDRTPNSRPACRTCSATCR